MSVFSVSIESLTPQEASIALRGSLGSMPFDEQVKIAFGCARPGNIAMLVSAPGGTWRMPGTAGDERLRLQPQALATPLQRLQRRAVLRLAGSLRDFNAAPLPLRAEGDWWFPEVGQPFSFLGAQPGVAAGNYFLQLGASKFIPLFLHQFTWALQPCRLVPVHEHHERFRTNSYPKSSRIPATLRAGGLVQFSIQRLWCTPRTVRFGQAALALIGANSGVDRMTPASYPVLQSFASARPVFRCQVKASDEALVALQLDTCIEWTSGGAVDSEIRRAYQGTEIEAFEHLFSEEELNALLSAFFIPGPPKTTAKN
jgi:hypothetical protein